MFLLVPTSAVSSLIGSLTYLHVHQGAWFGSQSWTVLYKSFRNRHSCLVLKSIFTLASLSVIPIAQEKNSRRCNRSRRLRLMEREPSSRFVVRCGTPDCEWGFPMLDLSELAFGA